ncbi:hypothetical protein [Marinomonas mediterranea]|jgi:hypothetical protein|uniref:Uncharacterized protein n=1 Tax=Marinomonas mediterranea (strain ATCC 700492 / JCM 21426 / NBRC 103028 / MMB-1) TaxID=717774 RepID=F2JXI0_MARM1|nr:hypothetical protein [Marinomonas mediterranea]ADZ91880.1 hypothetical protein Marme_2649 [Marinomonas mediterranea MMB-1]WCN17971.1 hypothetical protein GV053_13410 [Marinomonas mediterranea MMB-1]
MVLRRRRRVIVRYKASAKRKQKHSDNPPAALLETKEPASESAITTDQKHSTSEPPFNEASQLVNLANLEEGEPVAQFDANANPYQSFLNQLPSALTSMPKESFSHTPPSNTDLDETEAETETEASEHLDSSTEEKMDDQDSTAEKETINATEPLDDKLDYQTIDDENCNTFSKANKIHGSNEAKGLSFTLPEPHQPLSDQLQPDQPQLNQPKQTESVSQRPEKKWGY